jgi:hypothetical protein
MLVVFRTWPLTFTTSARPNACWTFVGVFFSGVQHSFVASVLFTDEAHLGRDSIITIHNQHQWAHKKNWSREYSFNYSSQTKCSRTHVCLDSFPCFGMWNSCPKVFPLLSVWRCIGRSLQLICLILWHSASPLSLPAVHKQISIILHCGIVIKMF